MIHFLLSSGTSQACSSCATDCLFMTSLFPHEGLLDSSFCLSLVFGLNRKTSFLLLCYVWCLPSLIHLHNVTSYSKTHSVHVTTPCAEKSSINNHLPRNTLTLDDVLSWNFHVTWYGEERSQALWRSNPKLGRLEHDSLFMTSYYYYSYCLCGACYIIPST